MSDRIHDAAARGFEAAAVEYEATRPDYPESAIDRMAQELEIRPGATVMDLGAGTGKLTRLLVPTGARMVALEPVESMRRTFVSAVPREARVAVVAGVAEALPFGEASFDAAVAGQAFHWFQGEAALAEIARVLRPAGRLALLWNVRDQSVEWVRRMTELIDPYERGVPREASGDWRRAFSATNFFGALNQRRFTHLQRLDEDGFVDRIASMSFIASLPDAERRGVLDRARDLARSVAGDGGEIVIPYHTELYWCARA